MGNVLITGCSGFLGRHLACHLGKNSRNRLFGITDEAHVQVPGVELHHLDIRDREKLAGLVESCRPDHVFHLAAITNVGFSWAHQHLTYAVNFMGSLHLMEALERSVPRCRLLIMSSAEIAGLSMTETEEGPKLSISSPYALSKAAMEMMGDLFNLRGTLEVIPVRAFNFTGPGQAPQFVAPDFARQIARIEAGLAPAVIRVGNLSARRDFSDVRDMARYVAGAAFRGEPGRPIRLGSGRVIPIQQILDTLLSLSPATIRVERDEHRFRPLDIPELGGPCRFLRDTLDMKPRYTLEQTLKDLLEEWRCRVREESER